MAIPTWLAVNGATPGEIGGFIGLVMLPWALFKLFYGVFMDRYTFPPMGRKRVWLVGAQAAAIISLLPLAIFAPGIHELALLATFAFLMNVAITIQDVAVDGIAVDLTPDEQRVRANSYMFAGQIIGTGVAAAVAGLLLKYYGIAAVAICFAAFLSIVLTLVILVRERPQEKMLPWTAGQASAECLDLHRAEWLPIFRDMQTAFFQPRILFFVLTFMMTGVMSASMDVGGPMYASEVLQWDETGYSSLAGVAGIVAGFIGMLILGIATERIGVLNITVLLFTIIGLSSLAFGLLAFEGQAELIFQIFVFSHYIAVQALVIGFAAMAMGLCLKSISASQFAILVALPSVARVISSSQMGGVYHVGGLPGFWILMAIASLFGLIVFLIFTRSNSTFELRQSTANDPSLRAPILGTTE